MNSKEFEDLAELLRETSDILEALEVIGSELPNNYRFPLKDELYGYALILEEFISDFSNRKC